MTTAATMPAEATAPAGPPTRAQWLHDMCTAASRANCGHCWTAPGPPCVTADATGTPGYHPARFRRAHRAGLITAAELAELTAGLLPGAIIWDTPRQVTQ